MAHIITTLRERTELARFHQKNGRPAAAFDSLLSAVELVVLDAERRDIAAAEAGARVDVRTAVRRSPKKATAVDTPLLDQNIERREPRTSYD